MENTGDGVQMLYVALTELPLVDRSVDFGEGVFLRGADATFTASHLLVNTDDESMRVKPGEIGADGLPLLPKPAFWKISDKATKITAEICIPDTTLKSFSQQYNLARFFCFLFRLWINPAIQIYALSDHSFSKLNEFDHTHARVIPLDSSSQKPRLALIDASSILDSIDWVKENWKAAHNLYTSNAEFQLAADALDGAQFVENEALALVSLWAAIETLFSPSKTELKFRVSALVASFLEQPGERRRMRQKSIGRLYRSEEHTSELQSQR